jgi:4-amino-4-deoxy-L-arabinose transferase-like glycosyltransferase
VLASSGLLMFMGRIVAWDIFCHMFMAGAIWALLIGWGKTKGAGGYFILAGLFMGLSFMSKGPVPFHSMLLPFLLSYLFVFGYKPIAIKRKGTLLAVFICLIVSGLWPLYIYFQLPAVSLAMASTEAGSWFPSHAKPFWHYLQFPALSGIWMIFILSALLYPHARKKVDTFGKNYTFLLIWMGLTVLLLSAIPKKSTHYLLPVLVPMSLMIGFYIRYLMAAFEQRQYTRGDLITLTAHVSVITLISFCIPGVFYYFGLRSGLITVVEFSIYSILFVGIGFLLLKSYREKKVFKIVLNSILFLSFSCLLIPPVAGKAAPQRSFMALMECRKKPELGQLELYSLPGMDPKEIWAVGRRVREVGTLNINMRSLNLPVALFSKTHPDQLRQEKEWENVSVQLLNVFNGKKKSETWYLSIIKNE